MTKNEFEKPFVALQEAFAHCVKENTGRQYWRALGHFPPSAWADAVQRIIARDERFPRIARVLEVVDEILHAQKRRAAQRRRGGPFAGSGEAIAKIPFPRPLKQALAQRLQGKIRQDDLEYLCRSYQQRHVPAACAEGCIEGVLHYRKVLGGISYTFAARCACGQGRALEEGLPDFGSLTT